MADNADAKNPPAGAANWLGLNRASLAVLIAIGGLGLSEELWRNFFGIHIKELTGDTLAAYVLWRNLGAEKTFLIGGAVGLLGTIYFWLTAPRVVSARAAPAE